MSELSILSDFSSAVQKVVQDALAQKDHELASREAALTIREKKVAHVLAQDHLSGRIELQVGSVLFHTTADILLRCPDSYFHGLLNPKFRKDGDSLFIARDGQVFAFILEFLTYGQIYTPIPTGMLQKLLLDAEFYLLDELKKQLEERPGHASATYCSLGSSGAVQNGACFSWPIQTHLPADSFLVAGDSVTVLRPGLYLIFCQYQSTASTHGLGAANLDLLIDGEVVARSYHGSANGYYDGHFLQYVANLEERSTIQCRYNSNQQGNLTQDPLGTRLSLVKLG